MKTINKVLNKGYDNRDCQELEIVDKNANKYIAAYHYESGENEILNFQQFKEFLTNLAVDKLDCFSEPEDGEENEEITFLTTWIKKVAEIETFEELRYYYTDCKDEYDDLKIFTYLDLNVSDIYKINNDKKEIIV